MPTAKPTLPELNGTKVDVVQKVGARYEKFGIALLNDADEGIVKALEYQFQRDCASINTEILRRWLQGSGLCPVNWSTLVNALEGIGM